MDIKIFFVLLFILFAPLRVMADGEALSQDTINRYNSVFLKQDDKGNMWTCYSDKDGYFHAKNSSLKKDFIINDKGGKVSKGFAVNVNRDNLYVAWREKTGSKKLFFREITEGGKTLSAPVLLDDNETEAMTRIQIGSDSRGNVYVLWFGEKIIENQQYHFYVAVSNDYGRTFSRPKNLTMGYGLAIYPALLVDEQNAYIFSQGFKDRKYYMIYSKTADNGKTWTEPTIIKEVPGTITNFIMPIKTGNRLHVFWYCTTETGPVTEKAFSDDGGKTWNVSDFADLNGLSLVYMTVAADAKGRMYFTYSGQEFGKKSGVSIITSGDKGDTWSKPMSLRHYPFTSTTALYPEIIASDDGTVVVVWTDYRNIRSNIYMQYSRDGGATWQDKDIPLEEPGKYNTFYFAYASEGFIKQGDAYHLLAFRFSSDYIPTENANLFPIDFTIKAAR